MKARPRDRMRDPFFAGLMFQIERMICAADHDAAEKGVVLKDSQVQSALNKAKGLARGRSPKLATDTETDRILAELVASIDYAPAELMEQRIGEDGSKEEHPLNKADWVLAIEGVIDSVKTRRSGVPGSRDYLDCVRDFIEQAESPDRPVTHRARLRYASAEARFAPVLRSAILWRWAKK